MFRWLAANASFCDQYARAKQAGCDALFEELLEIADDGSNDWMERELASGAIVSVPDHEHINRSRLRVDARKWALSKLNPKKYGESSRIAHTDPDGNVLRVEVTRVNPK